MNNRTGYGLRIVLGGYLAYLGIRMLIQTVNERPANMMFMGAMAVIFSVVGIAYVAYSLKKVWELRKEELKSQGDGESGTDLYQEEAAGVQEKEEKEVKSPAEDTEKISDEKTEKAPGPEAVPNEPAEANEPAEDQSGTQGTEEIENDYEEK